MKAATYTQGASFTVEDLPQPQIAPDEILIHVMVSSICGTDVRIIKNGHRKLRDGQKIVLGHEFAGVVEEVGADVKTLERGMRVAIAPNIGCGQCEMCVRGLTNMCTEYEAFGICMDGAHAEYVRVPARYIQQGNVVPLPAGVSWLEATLVEPLSCVVNSMNVCRIEMGDVMVIFGAGPIGLLHMFLGVLNGATRVIFVDPDARRLEQAKQLGANAAIEVKPGQTAEETNRLIMRETGGHGANVAVTACSVPSVQGQALSILAPYGRLCLFGGLPKDSEQVPINTNLIHYKNLLVGGMTGGSLIDFRTALKMIAAKRFDVTQIVSHVIPTLEMERAFSLCLSGEGTKVVIANSNGA